MAAHVGSGCCRTDTPRWIGHGGLSMGGYGAASRRRKASARATIPGPAVSGVPAVKGGWGAYSMKSCMSSAVSCPHSSAASVRAASIPAETPAAVRMLPRRTTRAWLGVMPNCRNVSRADQWVAASPPVRIPAAARINEPVHTLSVQRVVGYRQRNHARVSGLRICAGAFPPGTTRMSARVTRHSLGPPGDAERLSQR
jgi:hypothetical protein